jgi:hypothetical protein
MPKLLDSDAQIVCELHPYAWENFGVALEDLEEIAVASGCKLEWLDGRGELNDFVEYGTILINR